MDLTNKDVKNEAKKMLGDIIKNFRSEHGMTMQDFADQVGCTKSFISMIENNNDGRGRAPNPTMSTLSSIAEAMDMTLVELIEEITIDKRREKENFDSDSNEKKQDQQESHAAPFELINRGDELTKLISFAIGLDALELRKLYSLGMISFKMGEPEEKGTNKITYKEKKAATYKILEDEPEYRKHVAILRTLDDNGYRTILNAFWELRVYMAVCDPENKEDFKAFKIMLTETLSLLEYIYKRAIMNVDTEKIKLMSEEARRLKTNDPDKNGEIENNS